MTYDEFLSTRHIEADTVGFDMEPNAINPMLFGFQSHITRWALNKGRAAIFADCGLGKTPMQLAWAHHVSRKTKRPVLILAPLAVSLQTIGEGCKFGVAVNLCRTEEDIKDGVNITNYEILHHFSPDMLGGLVLDESSILKAYDGRRKRDIIDFGRMIPYRLACTATPAPNDYTELCNHAEFLGVMNENEVKALFFTQDGNTTTKWRLKRHAVKAFWQWMASWSVAIRKPSDLGYDDDDFILPELKIWHEIVDVDFRPDGQLFDTQAVTLADQRKARKDSITDRVNRCANLVNGVDGPWIVWCNLNAESDAIKKAIPGAVEVKGSDSTEHKEKSMLGFSAGEIRVLVTKPSIAGFGMNWQHCCNVAFVGLSHSYEQFYQAIRRSYRFGQENRVNAHIITSSAEQRIVANIERKEREVTKMMDEIVSHMSEEGQAGGLSRHEAEYQYEVTEGDMWRVILGDSVEAIESLEDESIGLSVFSPPFPGMYVYSNSRRDMGNTKDIGEMIQHFAFLSRKLLSKTMPGRHACIHLTQTLAQKARDGYIGIKDFRGAVIKMMEDNGWIYYGEVTIDKNPQLKAIRTKDRGLLFKTLANDASHMHMALADYLLQFRKPGDNPEPIRAGISSRYKNPDGWITQEEWIRWARPVWYSADFAPDEDGIKETDVLNVAQARDTNDERHLAPLQLGVIERAVKLWSNPGDLVFSPFGGVGSEGYMAVKLRRRAVIVELKRSYYESAVRNLRKAEHDLMQHTLFADLY